MLSYPSGMTVSSRALGVLSDALRAQRNQRRTRWRKLSPGRQALLVVAHLRKGETYADLACGFRIGTSTVYRYIREALELLAAMAPTLAQAIEVARRKAFVILVAELHALVVGAVCVGPEGMLTGSSAVPPSSRTRATAALMSSTAKKMRGCRDESSCGDPPMGSGPWIIE